jgi:DNA-binding beta-propeller fold protein YncE
MNRTPLSVGWLAALLLAGMLAGCATTTEPARLHFGMADAPEGARIAFPPEPEIPRYLYAGQLVGEGNFVRQEASGAARLWQIITGLLEGDPEPMVLQRPQSGAVDERGRIYVSDVSRGGVWVFDEAAGELLLWDRAEGLKQFRAPVGVAVGPQDTLFVADAELALVARLDAKGNPLPAIGKGILTRPTGLAWDAIGEKLYVADTYAHDIKVFDAEGRLERTIGTRGEAGDRFNFPSHIALWRDELYVADTMNARVVVLEAESGQVRRHIGQRGLSVGNLVRPKGVTVDSDGNVYVIESYYDHLLIFSHAGEFLMGIGGAGQETGRFYLPAGAWVDARNRIFVADMFNGRVIAFQYLGGEAETQE